MNESKPKSMRAFGLPEGTVRALLTLMFSGTVVAICIIGALQSNNIMEVLKQLIPIATFMLGFYVNKKS